MVRGGDGMRFGAAHRKLWGSVSCLAVLLGLLVAGCGGGSSSPPGGVTVAINPSIVRVVVTGTQQFAANVTGTASAATIAASNGPVRTSNTVTITTTAAHSFVVGQTVVISGVTDASFNGTFSIATVPSTTTFTYSQTGANATSGGGTVSSFAVKVKAVSIADNTKSATAVVSIDSGIQISVKPTSATVGTSENLQFIATITGSSNTAVN